jgi:hypothetical protein
VKTTRPRLQAHEGVPPGRIVGAKLAPVIATSRPPGARRARPRRHGDRRVGNAALDIGHHREWRVHQHDAGHDGGIEMIVDLRGVEARDGNGREREVSRSARVSASSLRTSAAGGLGEDAKQAGAGRRLQHAVGRGDGCGRRRRKPSGIGVENCWKAWPPPNARVRRQQSDDLRQRGEPCSRRPGFAEKRFPYLRRNRTVAASQAS